MAKKENTTPYEISEVYEKGPRVKGPRSRTDWDFLVYELKKMDITPGEAYRIVAEKKGNTNIRFQWKMMRFTLYIWARVEDTNGCFSISKIQLIVSTTEIPLSFKKSFHECDDGLFSTDGIATFNFSSVNFIIREAKDKIFNDDK